MLCVLGENVNVVGDIDLLKERNSVLERMEEFYVNIKFYNIIYIL